MIRTRHVHFFLPFVLLFCWFAILFYGLKQQSQSFYFQDETEHVTNGWMMFNYGKRLYTDLTSNHQPLPILFGGALMEVIPYNTLFQLIERLRVSMFLFQVVTGVLLTLRFRWKGALAVIFYTSLSFYFFGWYVLAESLAAPAIIWVLLSLFLPKKSEKKAAASLGVLDVVTTQAALWWLTFTLLPLWPFVALCELWILFHTNWKQRKIAVGTMLLLTGGLFLFINPLDWLRETLLNNVHFFLPYEKTLTSEVLPKVLLLPFNAFLSLGSDTARFIAGTTAILVGIALYWRKKLTTRHALLKLSLVITLILSLNTRVGNPQAVFFSGFHLFQYLAALCAVLAIAVVEFAQQPSSKGAVRYVPVILSLILVVTSSGWIFSKTDKLSQYFIQYSTFESYGNAIKAIKPENATLLTGPDGAGYMNIMGDIPFPGRQLFHLPWAYRSPMLRGAFTQMLSTNPPTFIYFPPIENNGFYEELQPVIAADYSALKRTDGSVTQLFVRNNVAQNVTEEQWRNIEAQEFQRLQN